MIATVQCNDRASALRHWRNRIRSLNEHLHASFVRNTEALEQQFPGTLTSARLLICVV